MLIEATISVCNLLTQRSEICKEIESAEGTLGWKKGDNKKRLPGSLEAAGVLRLLYFFYYPHVLTLLHLHNFILLYVALWEKSKNAELNIVIKGCFRFLYGNVHSAITYSCGISNKRTQWNGTISTQDLPWFHAKKLKQYLFYVYKNMNPY